MLCLTNTVTLAMIAYFDYVSYKIPNVIICGWIITILFGRLQGSITYNIDEQATVIASLLVAGSYIPFHHIVECNAGDFKLFGGLSLSLGLSNALSVILISLIFSFFPLASGIKKVPIGFLIFLGYVTFLVHKRLGVI